MDRSGAAARGRAHRQRALAPEEAETADREGPEPGVELTEVGPMSTGVPRFGIWIPVYGNWAGTDPALDAHDASFSRAKRLLVEAERLGFETALLAQHLINPRDQELDQLETWTATAALAAVTERIELIAAIKPKLFHPVVLAKMALGIEDISGGRFAINVVNAWFRPEIENAGIPFDDHDD